MNHHYVCRVARDGEVAGRPFWRARVVGDPPKQLMNGCGAISADAAMRTLVSSLLGAGSEDIAQGRAAPTGTWSFACELVADGPHAVLGAFCSGTEAPDIAWVLHARPDLVTALAASRAPIEKVFGAGTRVRLEVERDMGFEIHVIILSDDLFNKRINAFDKHWLSALSCMDLVFSVERLS